MESIAQSAEPQHSIKTKAFTVNTIGWIAWPTHIKASNPKTLIASPAFSIGATAPKLYAAISTT